MDFRNDKPQGLLPKNGQEPYPGEYACIVGVGKRKVYTGKDLQRWVKCFGSWWKFPEQVGL